MCDSRCAPQAAFELIAAAYPGAFAGYKMSVTESHQSSKVRFSCARARLASALTQSSRSPAAQADTSGTAKALVASFQKLGPKFEVDEIVKVRDAEQQLKMGVPGTSWLRDQFWRPCLMRRLAEAHLAGHAYHTYRLTSPDGLVNFEFQARVRASCRCMHASRRPLAHARSTTCAAGPSTRKARWMLWRSSQRAHASAPQRRCSTWWTCCRQAWHEV